MRFESLSDLQERTRAIVYVNKRCPSFDPCDDETIEKWVSSLDVKAYAIKDNRSVLGYCCFTIKRDSLFVETLFIYPEFRAAKDFISATVEFAERVAKENSLSSVTCDTIHPSLAKLLVEKHAFNLTYTFSKNV